MINEMSGMNCFTYLIPNEKSDEVISNPEKLSLNKYEVCKPLYYNIYNYKYIIPFIGLRLGRFQCFIRERTLSVLQREIKNIQNNLNVQYNGNKFKPQRVLELHK